MIKMILILSLFISSVSFADNLAESIVKTGTMKFCGPASDLSTCSATPVNGIGNGVISFNGGLTFHPVKAGGATVTDKALQQGTLQAFRVIERRKPENRNKKIVTVRGVQVEGQFEYDSFFKKKTFAVTKLYF